MIWQILKLEGSVGMVSWNALILLGEATLIGGVALVMWQAWDWKRRSKQGRAGH